MSETHRAIVADVELEQLVIAPPTITLRDAACLLTETRAGTLLLDGARLLEVTERDIVRAIAAGVSQDASVEDVAARAPDFVDPCTHITNAAAFMIASGRQSLVVAVDDRPIGLLTTGALVSALLGGQSWLGALRVALDVEGPLL